MTRYRTALFAGLAAVGLALAGCGGGSDDGLSAAEEQELRDEAAAAAAMARARIMALEEALGLEPGDDIGDSVADLNARIAELEADLKAKQDAEMAAAEEADRMEAERMAAEMAATAAKLYAGIGGQMGAVGTYATTDRIAGYDTAETAIVVQIGTDPVASAPTATLSEDKDATVAANHGWAGKMYTASPTGGGTYEAVVYSNVEAPKMGKKFGGAAANDEFEYALTSGVTDPAAATQNGEVAIDTSAAAGVPARVALTGVTRTAGTETFKFSASEVTERRIDIPGSYHGVSGTYYCTPTTRVNGCSASVAATGFTLTGGTWAFKPGDAAARVTSGKDSVYASYGWWLHKPVTGKWTASAFVDVKGTSTGTDDDDAAADITALQGTATYQGGAAGKYALASSTGGTNDAGHFTARATLEANFSKNISATGITGTIDQFVGADGESRDWEVELMGSAIGDTGIIRALNADGSTPPAATDAGAKTKWTIGGTTAASSGQWSGDLRHNGTDGVPETATGTFYTEYGTAGRMVGAFGANKQ